MKVYSAILNGTRTTAKKVNGHWMVGGDYLSKGSTVSIMLDHNGRPAWFNLRGCILKFSDYASADEIKAAA